MLIIDWKTSDMKGRDTGLFTIENGQMCNEWDTLPPSDNTCWKFFKIGEDEYKTVSTNGRSYFITVEVK